MTGRVFRFVVVGISAAALQWVLTYLLLRRGDSPFIAACVGQLIAFAYAYSLHRRWTFPGSSLNSSTLLRYAVVQILCAGLGGGLAQSLARYTSLDPVYLAAIVTIVVSAASYLLSSRWAFVN